MKSVHRGLAALGITVALGAIALLNACKHENSPVPYADSGYPSSVAKIMVSKCATAGCHNDKSYEGADGVRLDTWEQLFNGSNHGSVVVPYDIENSSLLSFINTDTAEGLVQLPTMPYHEAPLSKAEYNTIRDWIASGAPDAKGNIPFGTNAATRQKIYLTAQGCDLIHVIDADKQLVMRNIKIGKVSAIESPHCVRLSNDGMYAYTCFLGGNYVQKIDTRTDAIVGETQVSDGSSSQWNILHVSDDGTKVVAADFTQGVLKFINTSTMAIYNTISGSGLFVYPHGIAANPTFDTLYITAQNGNTIYKVSPSGFYKKISLNSTAANYSEGTLDPHEIMLTPDGSKYFVTCQSSNEVRVMDAHADTLIKAFSVPRKPQELALSKAKPYMLVTCMEATSTYPHGRGAVVVINYNTMQEVAGSPIYGDFFQPHGITVDDRNLKFYVASANVDPNGDAPHHVSACGGRIGWYSVYSLDNLQPVDGVRYETSVYPYSADTRFK